MGRKEKLLTKAEQNQIPRVYHFQILKRFYRYVAGHLKDKKVVIGCGTHHKVIGSQYSLKVAKPKIIR